MKKALFILLFLSATSVARAQFGIGQIILLGKIVAQDTLIYGATAKTAIQAVEIAKTAAQQYEMAKQMVREIDSLKYQGIQSLIWESPNLLNPDRYGMALPWVQAASGMQPAAPAYQQATIPVPMGEAPAYYASASPAQQQRIGSAYAWLQATDAENAAALQAIGDSNGAVQTGQIAINNLVTDSFASGFMDNPQLSQIALQQKQGIASAMNVQQHDLTNQLLTHILHEQVIANTRARNEEAAKLNADQIIHQQQAQAQQGVQGLASALNSFRY